MAATYTEVSLDDLEKFLKRGFRALRPRKEVRNGEYCYDLFLSDNVAIRVWTSVGQHASTGAGAGQDAIRVQLVGVRSQRPLMKGKAPIVKRTQNWRNSLQNRIEEMMETYEEKQDYWESRGGASPSESQSERPQGQGPSDKQIRYLMFLTRGLDRHDWYYAVPMASSLGLDRNRPPTEEELRHLTGYQASQLIGALKKAGFGQSRYAGDEEYSYDFTG